MHGKENLLPYCGHYSPAQNLAESGGHGKNTSDETVSKRTGEDLYVSVADAPILSGTLRFYPVKEVEYLRVRRGIVALIRKDPSARQRIDEDTMTLSDVEYIIEKASFEIIKLELDRNADD